MLIERVGGAKIPSVPRNIVYGRPLPYQTAVLTSNGCFGVRIATTCHSFVPFCGSHVGIDESLGMSVKYATTCDMRYFLALPLVCLRQTNSFHPLSYLALKAAYMIACSVLRLYLAIPCASLHGSPTATISLVFQCDKFCGEVREPI